MWNPTLLPVCRNNLQLSGDLAVEPVNFELPKDRNLAASCVLTCDLATHAAADELRERTVKALAGLQDQQALGNGLLHSPQDDNGLRAFRRH